MISRLQGKVVSLSAPFVTVDVQGVGYEVRCSRAVTDKLSLNVDLTVIVFTDVKENGIDLYGFCDQLEKQVFLLLKKVKGIGSRIASEIISEVDKLELLRAIGSGDVTRINRVRGVGKKIAERIVVELKDKVGEFAMEARGHHLEVEVVPLARFSDALDALKSLGFSARDAERALDEVKKTGGNEQMDSSELIRMALQFV